MNGFVMFWRAAAWEWPFIVGTVARGLTTGVLILLTTLVTRWWIRRNLKPLMSEKAQLRIQELEMKLLHCQSLQEEERERANHLTAIIKGSIATASHTLMNLQGSIKK